MRIAIVSDAWVPQINGVVTTLLALRRSLRAAGHEVVVIEPSTFNGVACPGYPEIELAWRPGRAMAEQLRAARPDAIHIATEGPLGWAARADCLRRGVPFTTALHSRFPEFLQVACGIPARWGYALLRRFHAPSAGVLVPSGGTCEILRRHGFRNLRRWSHGVDTGMFRPRPGARRGVPGPIFLYVGRISVEKNLPAFLSLELPGRKVVCGGGPLLARYQREFPQVQWLGPLAHERLPWIYAAADVFVHPSRTDTFGLGMLEAMACGTPVAAYPVAGPLDVVGNSLGGVLDQDLRSAALRALALPRAGPRERALAFDLDRVAAQFVASLAPSRPQDRGGRAASPSADTNSSVSPVATAFSAPSAIASSSQ